GPWANYTGRPTSGTITVDPRRATAVADAPCAQGVLTVRAKLMDRRTSRVESMVRRKSSTAGRKPTRTRSRVAARRSRPDRPAGDLAFSAPPELRWIYDTAPIGLAFLTPDCRYLHINQRLTDICGISVEGHLGRTVREIVPNIAGQVEELVGSIIANGEPVTDIEVSGQRADA